ncbi:hypothetical protein ThrDRAFT_01716 [Frankia casuarinae]|jgi:hypothetical protein|uniref:hypothetical protein n=1 Tax=unclassified Frankia TaxID=2632575 RepID=UPI0003CFB2ED|nr:MULTISPECIES: hypothetical protein [unclassified Frankia]ETA01955.1 hypothetical protein CcI6DRAFT_02641 [Frankia sp. CcI6]EYT92598.1 hypothetical protein ThrDRAFT_01716 [Frankia casuarinae]KFB05441.1 hypothetical protein ALLO2DRAFT_01680 [Frankia sp. Allo2]OAA24645.1 hypothetical protein AAY23_104561 [Frankia casuarinae]
MDRTEPKTGSDSVGSATPFTGRTAVAVRHGITGVVFVIAVLAFAFGFGSGWSLGLQLGVPGWTAPLVAPAVDLSVMALLAAVQYLRANGAPGRLVGPRLLLVLCGLMTFALNTTKPLLDGAWGRAAFDAIAPGLLIGWSEVAPRLLALLHQPAVPDGPSPAVPAIRDDDGTTEAEVPDRPRPQTVLAPALVRRARQADAAHRKATGRPITRDALREELRISNAVAGQLVRTIRAERRNQ